MCAMTGRSATQIGSSVAVLCLLLVICVLGVQRSLWTPDEPREAEISREMLMSPGIVPTLNGRAFIEKPPLYYWTVAGIFALTGPTAAAARSVSAAAGFLTLLVVFLWGRREFSTRVGMLASLGLATSVQFMISTHWVLIDPLLMLFTTLAAWAGWELIGRRGGLKAAGIFYVALVLALWTKGLIGPVLLAFGLLAFMAFQRSLIPLRRLHPLAGVASLLAATAVLTAAIYLSDGFQAVREWLWVNHVQRFIDPTYTGHEQPFYYYLSALPIAVFPWWVPLADALRPSRWRQGSAPGLDVKRYWGALTVGMVAKRGIYLLPLLPPLFLLLAANTEAWWQDSAKSPLGSRAWWIQIALVALLAAAPAAVGLVYLRVLDPFTIGFLVALGAVLAAVVLFTLRRDAVKGVAAVGVCAVAAVYGLVVVTPRLAEPEKNMTPFVAWVGEQLPAGQPVYAFGRIDETLEGIVPFVTHRRLVTLEASTIAEAPPRFVLVQDKEGGATAPDLEKNRYALVRERSFGPGRYMALWQRNLDTAARDSAQDGRESNGPSRR
jgi:4-amino-4-deoxy-L-arabinose transferase-like glycosyltransferase